MFPSNELKRNENIEGGIKVFMDFTGGEKMLQKLLNIETYEKVVILCCGSFTLLILFLLLRQGF
jgi:hypothetical protein